MQQHRLILDRMESSDVPDVTPGRVQLESRANRSAIIRRRVTLEHDTVINNADLVPRKPVLLCEAVHTELADPGDRVGQGPQQPSVREPTFVGNSVGKMPAVLGQNEPECSTQNQLRQRRIEKRCVLMRVNQLNATLPD